MAETTRVGSAGEGGRAMWKKVDWSRRRSPRAMAAARSASKLLTNHRVVAPASIRGARLGGSASSRLDRRWKERELRLRCQPDQAGGVREDDLVKGDAAAEESGRPTSAGNGSSAQDADSGSERRFERRRQFRGADIARVRAKTVQRSVRRIKLPFSRSQLKTLGLGCLFAGWYIFNVYFNVYNKRVLNAFPYPGLCTLVHLSVGSLCMAVIWGLGLRKAPKLRTTTVLQVLPLGALHLLGFAFTNASLGSVAVSFTHTIKALEPFFTAIFSAFILGSIPSLISMLALVPIVSGVILASFTEASFTWGGLVFALGSNFSFQLRNVLSKQYMTTKAYESQEGGLTTDALDQINLFACITISACVMMFPCAYFLDAGRLTAAMGSQGVASVATKPLGQLFWWSFLAGLCRFGDVLVSYAILAQVSPVTHSVGNCLKRVIVIAASIFIFQNPVSSKNVMGTVLAITGVFLYSMTKRMDEGKIGRLPFDPIIRKFSRSLQKVGIFKSKKPKVDTKASDSEDQDDEGGKVEYYL